MTEELPDRADVLIIGGGPGGYAAAFRAADLGREVVLVSDEEQLGGVCLLRGCIPSKALLEVADLLLLSQEAERRGVQLGDPEIDLDRLRTWKQETTQQLVDGLDGLMRQRDIRVVRARAVFSGAGTVTLDGNGNDGELAFDHAIVATGSAPVPLPGTTFGERIIDAAGALDLPDIPERLLVVGGGYVGLELGSVYAAFGSQVTLVEMTDRLLPPTDQDLVEPLAARIRERFHAVHLETVVTELEEEEQQVRASFEGEDAPGTQTFDRVLVAIGRRPSSADIGLETTAVELDDDGLIVVDDRRCTAEQSIYAVGDVTGGYQLAHEAFHEGRVAAEAIAGEPASFDVRAVPAVVYTDPQIAWCGLTEREAAERDHEVEIATFPWKASGRALTLGGEEGMTKLVCEPGSGRILGVGVVGRRAESLIAEGVLAVEMGAVTEDLARSLAPHPTLSETIHEAAQAGLGSPIHLAPRRKAARD